MRSSRLLSAQLLTPVGVSCATTRLHALALSGASTEPTSFASEASTLLNNIRTPAALVAGASLSAAFVLQPAASERVAIGLAKRIYLLIAVGAVASELIAVLVSSCTLGKLTAENKLSPANATVVGFMKEHYELELLATEFNFQIGLLGLCAMLGIRAWVAFACPRFAKIAVGLVASALCIMLSFMPFESNLPKMFVRYLGLLVAKCVRERSLLLAVGLAVAAYSLGEAGLAARFMLTRWIPGQEGARLFSDPM